MTIHPTAIIDSGAEIDGSVTVGPYAIIEKGVKIGPETVVAPHAIITGLTEIGARNTIGSFSTIGTPPQDLTYNNEDTKVIIGDDNRIREYVSIHRGTPKDRGVTTVGNGNMLMAYAHIAHDCIIGNDVIMANAATLAGHVEVGDKATFGGIVGVHQFVRIGTFSYIGGVSGISMDIPPYMLVAGTRNKMRITGLNKVGLKRSGFSSETIQKLTMAYRIIFKSPDLLLKDALAKALDEVPDCPEVEKLVDFFKTSSRGVVRASDDG